MYVYLLIEDSNDWEDMKIFLDEDDAIDASLRHPHSRVEIFGRDEHGSFTPTYSYYKNGKLVRGPCL